MKHFLPHKYLHESITFILRLKIQATTREMGERKNNTCTHGVWRTFTQQAGGYNRKQNSSSEEKYSHIFVQQVTK